MIVPLVASVTLLPISLSAVAVYLLLGVVGMPVFAGWTSGVGIVIGPTGGYLIGMLLFPLIIGWGIKLSAKWYALTAWNLIAAFLQLGFGTVWLAVAAKMPLANAMATGLSGLHHTNFNQSGHCRRFGDDDWAGDASPIGKEY